MKAVADALEVARSHLHEKVRRLAKPRGSCRKPDDGDLLPLIRRLVDERPTYGYRRITALAKGSSSKPGSRWPTISRSSSCGRTACSSPGTPVEGRVGSTTAKSLSCARTCDGAQTIRDLLLER